MKPGSWGLKLPEPSCHLKLNFLIYFARFITPGWKAVNHPSFWVNPPEGNAVSWKRERQMSLMGRGFQEQCVWQGSREPWQGAAEGIDKLLKEHVSTDFAIWLASPNWVSSSELQVDAYLIFSYKWKAEGQMIICGNHNLPNSQNSCYCSSESLIDITVFHVSKIYVISYLPLPL